MEFLNEIFHLLHHFFLVSSLNASTPTWEGYKHHVLEHQKKIPGWCTLEKADKLMQLIYDTQPKICIEIGVFGGSSIYPTASALKYLGAGTVYGAHSQKVGS